MRQHRDYCGAMLHISLVPERVPSEHHDKDHVKTKHAVFCQDGARLSSRGPQRPLDSTAAVAGFM